LVAGTGNIVSPHAMALVRLPFVVPGVETHRADGARQRCGGEGREVGLTRYPGSGAAPRYDPEFTVRPVVRTRHSAQFRDRGLQ
jgi:hypothetical protein